MKARQVFGAAKHRLKRTLRRIAALDLRAGVPATYWNLEALPNRGLCLQGLSLDSLLQKWGSPLYVIDAAALKANACRFQAFTQRGCEVYYSYKTNPVPFVLSTLHALGIGAEVISAYELWLALRLGVPPERIVYNGPVKSADSIRHAIDRDIGLLTANHAEELSMFAKIAESARKRPRVGLRVNTSSGWSGQFGVPIAGDAARRAFAAARGNPHLDLCAIHAHRGGMIRSEAELIGFVDEVLRFSDVIADDCKLDVSILDFGGSLCTPAVSSFSVWDRRMNRTVFRDIPAPDVQSALSIERYLEVLTEMVRVHYTKVSRRQPRVFVEPGRSMTSPTQLLLASVHSLKQAEDRTYAILDGGINIAEPVRSEYHQLLPVTHVREPAARLYTVVGPICTPGDTLYPAVRLPELRVGDSLAIMDAGAYFVPFSTSFSFPQPAIVAVDNGTDFLVRRHERFDDIAERDDRSRD